MQTALPGPACCHHRLHLSHAMRPATNPADDARAHQACEDVGVPNQAGALALVAIFGLLSLCSGPPLDEPSAAAPSTDESAPCFYVREVERIDVRGLGSGPGQIRLVL